MTTRTIMLVEDNPDDEILTLRALKKNSILNDIVVARDGAEALEVIFAKASSGEPLPGLILLDLKLPKVDGIEVLRQAKADPRTKMIPIVVLTSSKQERDIVESYELGVNSYMLKPVDFGQFTEAVRSLGLYWLVYNQAPVRD
jgi:two-component system, response regulator